MKKIITVITFIMLLSCNNEKIKVVTLNSDLPQILPFIDEFNKSNNDIKIILNIDISSENGDLVIFRGQVEDSPIETEKLNNLFKEGLFENNFYPDIINSVKKSNGDIFLLPLTFDLPGLIYLRDKHKHNSNIDIMEFLSKKDKIFSPYWDTNFILWYYLSALPEIGLSERYIDKNEFIKTAKSVKDQLVDRKDKWDVDLFNKKYRHLSPELLLHRSLIDYYFYFLSDYVELTPSQKSETSFSILSRDKLITVNDSMIFVGINKNSKNKKAANKVLTWMFQNKNQRTFIKNNFNQNGYYSLFNGELSTLVSITKETLPLYYPELKLLIPEKDMITTTNNLPKLWPSIKQEIFVPLFSDTKNLNIDQWDKKQMEYYNDWSKKHNK